MELVFATHNQGKLKELQALVPAGIRLLSLDDIGCHEEIPETADTFKGNALLKAQYVQKHYGLPCFADDSGLEVTALNGAPGVYSARYSGPDGNSESNMDKLLLALKDKTDRSAQFVTVIALINGGQTHYFRGVCAGEILQQRQGNAGFGYDPIFKPEDYQQSFAQMPLALKSAISHRGKAVAKLIAHLTNNGLIV